MNALNDEDKVQDTIGDFDLSFVNDAHIVSNDNPLATDEDGTLIIDAATVLKNDSDIDGDVISIDKDSLSAENGTVSLDANGNIVYVPNKDFNGDDTITYKVTDGNLLSNAAEITVKVNAVDDAAVLDFDNTPVENILITNPSFESTQFTDGGWNNSISNGWIQTGSSGEFNPNSNNHMTNEATDGNNIGWINSGSISQILSEVLANNTTYELQLDLGDRKDTDAGDYSVKLYAGDELLKTITQDDFPLVDDDFTTVSLEVDTSKLPDDFAGFNQPLTIEVNKISGTQLNIDNVAMTKTEDDVLNINDIDGGTLDMHTLLSNVTASHAGNQSDNSLDEIDLTSGDHILSNISVADVIAMTDDDNTLKIITDGKKDSENGDTVKLDNSLWTKDDSYDADGTDSEGYSQYTNVSGDNLVKLLIEQDNVDFNN